MMTTTSISVHSKKSHWYFGDAALHIEMVDEGAGAFFRISDTLGGGASVSVDIDELRELLKAAEKMIAQPGVEDG